uniref:Protein-tyrosine-phosphatase n=2 Tax=Caenorhabditis tropicalis TaxID=1561998 RepID=A0A1I7V159_9PELO
MPKVKEAPTTLFFSFPHPPRYRLSIFFNPSPKSDDVSSMKSLFGRDQPGPSTTDHGSTRNLLTVPESPIPSRRRELSEVFDEFRRKSISELSLVMDALRGSPSPGSSQYIHPERASQSTGNLNPPKKGRRRRKVQKTWQAMSPGNFSKQLQLVQEEKAMQAVPTAPVDASKFVAYVQERRKKRILFKGEYLMVNRSIDNNKCRCDVGSTMMDRNPYPDTLPYDHNRVILPRIDNDENSHYINASYVNSWLRDKAYVVTQAVRTKPMNAEFWRMVWELGSNCIVMLTKVFDFMRVMCLQYWPQTKFQFREIEVETTEVKTYSHFVIRTFKLTRKTEESIETRIVKHFHFTEWELDSFPYISAFIELRRRVRQFMEKFPVDAPMVVHCSNGAGRSGAFLALDANLELMKKTGQLDFFEYAKTLVNSRPHLIDSVEQYMFVYEVLSEAVMCNVQPIEMHLLKERSSMYKAKKNRELLESQETHENKLLMHLTPTLRIGDCAGGHRLENRGKNRDVMVVPPDHARPYLQTLHGESKDYTYINAVEVDGFTRKAEFIVTEWPKQSTVDSFWTLIYDHACHTVVNLSNQGSQRHYPSFIHNKGKANYGPFIVEVMNYHQYPAMTSHMVKVMKRIDPPNARSAMKIPTLEGVPGYQARPGIIPGQSFRFKPMYRGRFREPRDSSSSSDEDSESMEEVTSLFGSSQTTSENF